MPIISFNQFINATRPYIETPSDILTICRTVTNGMKEYSTGFSAGLRKVWEQSSNEIIDEINFELMIRN